MQAILPRMFQTLTRPARSGQAIILIALGFVALIGFTGIATDTGLLYIRYTTLSRATDSAAVAAAATLRQGPDYLSMVNAATHYLSLHGISATSVLVETCATDVQYYETNTMKLAAGSATATDDATAYNALIVTPGEQLCTRSAAKLVRVSAQAVAQTTFLSLLGFNNIQLTSSSISQAASLDAVVLLDSSYSEAADTKNNVFLAWEYSKPTAFDATTYDNFADFTSQKSPDAQGVLQPDGLNLKSYNENDPYGKTGSIRAECRWPQALNPDNAGNKGPYQFDSSGNVTVDYTDPATGSTAAGYGSLSSYPPNYHYGGCCNAPVNIDLSKVSGTNLTPFLTDSNVLHNGFYNGGGYVDGQDPELANGSGKIVFNFMPTNLTPTALPAKRKAYPAIQVISTKRDFTQRDYISLICQPFRDVRAGAYAFLNNVNFQGGDRTFMVTFDTNFHELTVGGEYNNTTDFPTATGTFPGLTNRNDAIYALYRFGGVESSATGYGTSCPSIKAPNYNYNGWFQDQATGFPDVLKDLTTDPYSHGTLTYETAAPCTTTNTGGAILAGQSLLTNPAWIRRDAVWVMIVMSAGYPTHTPGLTGIGAGTVRENISTIQPGTPMSFTGYPVSYNAWGAISNLQVGALSDPGFCPWQTFCDTPLANTLPLLDKNHKDLQTAAIPDGKYYQDQAGAIAINPSTSPAANPALKPPDVLNKYTIAGGTAGYANYCTAQANPIWWSESLNAPLAQPYYIGATQVQGTLTFWQNPKKDANYNDWQVNGGSRVDCTAADPDIRHFCMNPKSGIINAADAACDKNYGAMDFARDMVDYAALDQWTSKQKGNFITMYSIFFGRSTSNFPGNYNPNDPAAATPVACPLNESFAANSAPATQPNCEPDIGSYILGAKFMRYVADAGDNGQIDNHVQRWYRDQWNNNPSVIANPMQPALTSPAIPNSAGRTSYDGTDPLYTSAPYNYGPEDPCAVYDFDENIDPAKSGVINNPRKSNTQPNPLPAYNLVWDPTKGNAHILYSVAPYNQGTGTSQVTGIGYEDLYRYSCGNYYYAKTADAVQNAFISISNRLFVQIAH